jgi:hypothetical protein
MKRLLLILPLLFFSFCTVQKRHYQKGYFVSWNSSTRSLHKNTTGEQFHKHPDILTASSNTNPKLYKPQQDAIPVQMDLLPPSQKIGLPEDSCDVIIFKNGSEVSAKILEVNQELIKYKKCDMLDGPLYSERRSEIFMLKYKNGVREVIHTEKTPEVSSRQQPTDRGDYKRKKLNTKLATSAFVFSILGFYPLLFVGGIAAIIMSVIQLNNITTYPEEYGGEKKARTALILGIISIVTSILIFSIAFLL